MLVPKRIAGVSRSTAEAEATGPANTMTCAAMMVATVPATLGSHPRGRGVTSARVGDAASEPPERYMTVIATTGRAANRICVTSRATSGARPPGASAVTIAAEPSATAATTTVTTRKTTPTGPSRPAVLVQLRRSESRTPSRSSHTAGRASDQRTAITIAAAKGIASMTSVVVEGHHAGRLSAALRTLTSRPTSPVTMSTGVRTAASETAPSHTSTVPSATKARRAPRPAAAVVDARRRVRAASASKDVAPAHTNSMSTATMSTGAIATAAIPMRVLRSVPP